MTIHYTYDKAGNRLTMADSVTGEQTYEYDTLNRLTGIVNPLSHSASFTYDALSRMTQKTFSNGITSNFSYDAASQLTSLTSSLRGQPTDGPDEAISSFTYNYDKVGNRTALTQARSGVPGLNSALTYIYDDLNRLTDAMRPLTGDPGETFDYDEAGNRLQKDGDIQNAVFDAANRLLEDKLFIYAYDKNGNLISKTEKSSGLITTYIYDAENQLIRINLPGGSFSEYRYDGLGRRIEKSVVLGLQSVVSRYVYDGEDILLEFDGANTLKARYTHGAGIDEPLIMERFSVIPAEAGIYFYLTDGLGSITELTDSAGAVVESYLYDSFGNLTLFDAQGNLLSIHDSRSTIHYSFTGREFDPESGLYYYRARYYDSSVGRFMSEDPILSTNLYSYTDNNPVNRTDPLGLWYIDVSFGVGWWGAVGVGGVLFSNQGIFTYAGGGAGTPGPSGGITWSSSDPTPGWNYGVQGGLPFFVGGQRGIDNQGNKFWEAGLVSPGLSGVAYFVERVKWPWEKNWLCDKK